MPSSKTISLLLLTGLLTACGGSNSSKLPTIDTPVTDTTTINDFIVIGSSAAIAGKIPINTSINNGAFKIQWNVDSSDPYHVNIYLSNDNTLGGDIVIFSQNCGSLSLLYNCNQSTDFDCRFTNSNKLSCGSITTTNQEVDITSFLGTIPKTAWLILGACNALLTDCETSAMEIELQ